MATVTTHVDNAVAPKKLGNDVITVQKRINFATYPAGSGDVVQCIKVPKGAVVTHVLVHVATAEGGALTADVGDGVDDNGYDNDIDLNAAAGTYYGPTSGTDAYALIGGRLYLVADTIDLTLSAAADTAVVDVIASYYISEAVANA